MKTKLSIVWKSISAILLIALVSACSSGNSTSLKSINLTGTWVGTIQDNPNLAYDVRILFLQENNLFQSATEQAPVTYSITFTNPSDGVSTGCPGTINNLTATLTLNSEPAQLSSQEFTALATNSSISGQAVFGGLCGGPINLRRI